VGISGKAMGIQAEKGHQVSQRRGADLKGRDVLGRKDAR
jgi:hypothetical protein